MMQKGGRRAKKQFKFNNGTGGAVILFNRLCSYFYFEMLYMVSKRIGAERPATGLPRIARLGFDGHAELISASLAPEAKRNLSVSVIPIINF